MKIFTAVQRVAVNNGFVHYLHVGPDDAFTSNPKLTTHKRALVNMLDVPLTNWSYYVDADDIRPGSKVYTIQQKADSYLGLLYFQIGRDIAWISKQEAIQEIARLRAIYTDKVLCIFSFVVDRDLPVIDHGPVPADAYDPDDLSDVDDNGRPW